MALVATLKQTKSFTGEWNGGGSPFALTAFTPAANSLLVVAAGGNDNGGTGFMLSATCSGGSLTWTKLTYADNGSLFVARSAIFYAIVGASPVSTTISISVSIPGQFSISAWECTGYDTGTPLGGKAALANQANNGAVTMTLDAAPASDSIVLRHLHRNCDPPSGTFAATGVTGFSQDAVSDLNGSYVWSQSSRRTGSTSTAAGFDDVQSGTESAKNYETAMCAVEVKSAGGGGGGLSIPVAMAQYRQRWN